jgi:Ca2+:H+ antiporter
MTTAQGFRFRAWDLLLLLTPLAIGLSWAALPPWVILALSAVAMVPVAGLIGDATQGVAHYTGPRIGGLLNATLGNGAELIITIVAIRSGLLELVKASITGSILGNLLFVLGISMLAGGWKNGLQSFGRRKASNDSILLVLAMTALAIPSRFVQSSGGIKEAPQVEALSLGVAGMMIVIYALGLVHANQADGGTVAPASHASHAPGRYRLGSGIAALSLATISLVLLSEILVRQIEPVVAALGVSEFFLGIILVPLIGNVAEHLVAVQAAVRNQMALSVEIAIGSSLQIALLVAPVLVFISLLMRNPLTLVFNRFELIALGGGVLITALVASDGESNWLEGAALVGVYLIMGLAFYFLP